MPHALAIDLGGTAIKGGVYNALGEQLGMHSLPTPQPSSPAAVLRALQELMRALDPQGQIRRVGVGVPGITDGRVVRTAINLHQWQDVPLAQQLEQLTQTQVVLANDANCAGLGEVWLGAGRGYEDVLLLTLGTGVGGAVILGGELFIGHRGAAGELGHIGVVNDGHPCNCGNFGCLEQYVSSTAIERLTGQSPHHLGTAAEKQDPTALAHWETMGSLLGAGLVSLIYTFTPQAIVIGGGVSGSSHFFLPKARAVVEQRVLAACREGLVIVPAELGNDAGMAGAARLAFQKVP